MSQSTSPRVPQYRRQSGAGGGRAFVVLGGVRHYLGRYDTTDSRREYHRLVAEYLAAGGRLPVPADQVTIVELLNAFRRHAAERYRRRDGSPTAEQANFRSLLKLVNELYGGTLAEQFRGPALQALRLVMVRRGWSRRYVNRQIVRVRTIFKWGVAQGLVSPNTHAVLCAVDGLRAGQTDAMDYPPVAPVAQDRIDAIMPFVPAVIADMVRVQLLTGMRPGELCSLKPSEIDKTAPVWVYKPSDHKLLHRGRVRMIAIGPRAQAILMTYLTHRPLNARVFSPIDAQQQRREAQHAARQTPLSCGNRPGTNRVRRRIRSQRDYYTSTTYARAIRYACEAAWPHATITGIPAAERTKEQVAALKAWNDEHLWTPNQLRHSAATRIRSEAGLEMARAVLGHSTFAVTEIFYAELDMAKVSTLMRKIG